MDQRDQELLDKQLRAVRRPRNDGTMILMLVAVFFAGLTLGGVLIARESEPMRIASNDATAMISVPPGASPSIRQ